MGFQVLLLLVGLTSPTAAQVPTFLATPTFASHTPYSVVWADFNGDGKRDLAAAQYGDHTVAVWLGNGDGTFQPPATYLLPDSAKAIAAGDIDGDGKPDIVAARDFTANVTVLLNNGNGTFRIGQTIHCPAQSDSVAITDLNIDGKADLVVTGSGVAPGAPSQGAVSVLLGNGDGTFQTPIAYYALPGPASVAAGDFNGDGRPDIAVSNGLYSQVVILLNDGTGKLGAPRTFATALGTRALVVADLNGDGKLDIAAAADGGTSLRGYVSVLLGNGNGTFQPAVDYPAGELPVALAAADYNGDGKLDLAVANQLSGDVSVLIGNGNGTFVLTGYFLVHPPTCITGVDLNGDGKADVIVGVTANAPLNNLPGNDGGLSVMMAVGSGNLSAARNFPSNRYPSAAALGDFNRDGILDVALAIKGAVGGGGVQIFIGNGDGTFQPGLTYLTAPNLAPTALTIGDFNRDGKLDLAVAEHNNNPGSGDIWILLGSGDGTFQELPGRLTVSDPVSIVAGDFNQDAKLDLAVADQQTGLIGLFRGNGDGTFQPALTHPATAISIASGDFNGDGKPDLATVDAILLGNGDGTFQTPIPFGPANAPQCVAVADFNRDGKLDLAVCNSSALPVTGPGLVSIFLGNGNGTFQSPAEYKTGYYPGAISIGDFNGDGRLDVVASNPGSTDVSIFTGNGDGSFQPALRLDAGIYPISIATGDLNGDGRPDIAVANLVSSNFSVLLNTTVAQVSITLTSTPPGLTANFDNAPCTTPCVFNDLPFGSRHMIGAVTPQPGGPGTRYLWTGWNDGGATSRSVVATTATYTSGYAAQYQLVTQAAPSSGSAVSPPSGGYYDPGTVVNVLATASPGATFVNWTGPVAATNLAATTVVLDGPKSVTANFSSGGFNPIRVRCGSGTNYVDSNGQLWTADTGFTGVNTSTFTTGSPIAATTTAALYQTERFATSVSLTYQFAVPNGTYWIRLKFAEIYFTSAGQRTFDIVINGVTVYPAFDIVASAGSALAATDRIFPFTTNTGALTIQLVPVVSLPKLNAIEILAVGPQVTVSPTAISLTPPAQRQFSANVPVNWTVSAGSISSTGLFTPPATFAPGQKVMVTATSQADGTQSASAAITLLGPWQSSDIGGVNAAGTFNGANGAYTISGAGDVNGTADAFRFTAQPFTGDVSLTTRVTASGCCVLPSKAGLMFRTGFSAADPHVFLSVYSNIVGLLESRTAAGSGTTVNFGGTGIYWLRLVRTGNTFRGYISAEGVSWIPVGAPVTIPTAAGTLFGGFAVSSGFAPAYTATFDSLTVGSPVSVSVDQTLVTLGPGQQAPFSATVLGSANTGVTWSISPALGAIDSTGLYTAPAFSGQQSVTVTATSAADPAKSSSAVATLSSVLAAPVRVNAGGPAHIDPNGVLWNADTGALTGNVYSSGAPIAGTATPYLYQTERFAAGSPLTYSFLVPSGRTYTVTLKMAEIYFQGPCNRQMNITINGVAVQANPFDPFAAAGAAYQAIDLTVPNVAAPLGRITVALAPVGGSSPKVSAIQIQ